MKRLLALFLALTMLFSAVPTLADALPAENDLPQVGDLVYGFAVTAIREFPLVGAQLVLFEHQKTGGKMLWIANEDTNRAFELSFATRPYDNTGLPHVFEHATLMGSESYPAQTLFFNVNYQTYNTFMNAYTTDAVTAYPLASLSEEQLLHLADFYVDSCFHPLIMTEKSIFDTQAWHYNLPSLEDELTYEGVVYSEMQGAFTLARSAMDFANGTTFPGASLSYNSGGVPEHIPELTWEAVKEYHDLFYHPSNCFCLLYGQFEDYSAFLALLDEAFSVYDKAEPLETEAAYQRITEPVVAVNAYPMAEGTDVTNQSVIYYYVLCPGMKEDREQELLADNLCSMLSMPSSVLSERFKNAFPAGTLTVGRELAAPDDAICFTAAGMNEGDAEAFKALVDEAIAEVAENGFPQDMMDIVQSSLSISAKLAPESGDPVMGVMYSFIYHNAVTGNPFAYAEASENLNRLDEENSQGLLKDAAARWLKDAALYTLTTTYPAPGEKEKQDAALKEKLAAVKAGMTQEELQSIVDAANAGPVSEDTTELMAKIKAVTTENLPEEVKIYPVNDETDENGIRHIEVTAGVDGIGYVELELDAAALPQEDIHWLRLFTRILGMLDTEVHTKEELTALVSRYLYNKIFGVNCVDLIDDIHPYVTAEWYALDDDLAAGYDLVYELLFQTKFDDAQRLADLIQEQKNTVRATINSSPYQVMLYRGLADHYPYYQFVGYMNFLDYYAFLEDLEALIAENPEAVTARLEAVQAFIHNNTGAVAGFAGNEQSIALNRPLADAFLGKLDTVHRERAVYDLPVPSQREALIIDGNVQYNCVIASVDDLKLEEYDAGIGAVTTLVSDKLLIPIVRDQMGVYDVIHQAVDNGCLFLISYRDPNLRETFEVYAGLADMIAALDLDQDTLDGYIMNVYAGLAKPAGELSGAVSVIDETLKGHSQEKMLGYMRQVKAVTPETVQAAAEQYRKAWENGVHSTAGSAAAINANADLFDVILNPFGTVDATQVELADAPEGSEYYEAVRFVFENNLMKASYEDAFGVDDDATAGDLYAAFYTLIGGAPFAPEEAMAFFAQYGAVPEGLEADTVLSHGMSDQIFVIFGALLGMQLEADAPNETTELPISRGELADQIMLLCSILQ